MMKDEIEGDSSDKHIYIYIIVISVHQQHTNHRCVLCSGPFVAEVPIDEEKSRSAAPGGAELPSSLVAEPRHGAPARWPTKDR